MLAAVVFMPSSPPQSYFKAAQNSVVFSTIFHSAVEWEPGTSAQCNFHHFIQVCRQTGFPLQSVFGMCLHTRSSQAAPMENNTSENEAIIQA